MVKCASGDRCKLQQHDTTNVSHQCLECRLKIHGILCSAVPDEAEDNIFVCFQCYEDPFNQQRTKHQDEDKENNDPNKQQYQGDGASNRRGRAHYHLPTARNRPLSTTVFRTGELVNIDPSRRSEGGRAFILDEAKTPSRKNTIYKARYVVSHRISPAVKEPRLHPAILETTGRRKTGDETRKPSLMSINYDPKLHNRQLVHSTNQLSKEKTIKLAPVQKLLHDVTEWKKNQSIGAIPPQHPIVRFIYKHQDKGSEKGYLRTLQAKADGRDISSKRLDQIEWRLVLKMRDEMDSANKMMLRSKCHGLPTEGLAHAWGITKNALNKKRQQVSQHPTLSTERKTRNDKGKSILNDEKKRLQYITPYAVFKKQRIAEAADICDPITTNDVKEEWMSLPADERRIFNIQAENLLLIAPHLQCDIKKIMLQTNGSVTWRCLESELTKGNNGTKTISKDSIARYVMGLANSCYTTTRIFPKLDAHHKERRYQWAIAFWMFWDAAKIFAPKVRMMHIDMDEKWFFEIVVRKKNKCVPMFGVAPVNHSIRHKSHLEKTMVICSSAFLPHNNDMTSGGVAYKLAFDRVGAMGVAKRDSYKRVYRGDGTHHYPKLPENLLRREGDPMWRNLEITGSSRGTTKDPKFPLIDWFRNQEIPRIEQLIQKLEMENPGVRFIPEYQYDGAGPHQDAVLNEFLKKEFRERGWLFLFQPSQSPLTNVNDRCIFPALSKKVTEIQGLKNNSFSLGDKLWEVCEQAWDEFPEMTIARAYVGHHQIVNAILRDKGGDAFAREKNGLHCGIRKASVPYYPTDEDGNISANQPSGIEMITLQDEINMDSLKYKRPDLSLLDNKLSDSLKREQLEFIVDCADEQTEHELQEYACALNELYERE